MGAQRERSALTGSEHHLDPLLAAYGDAPCSHGGPTHLGAPGVGHDHLTVLAELDAQHPLGLPRIGDP